MSTRPVAPAESGQTAAPSGGGGEAPRRVPTGQPRFDRSPEVDGAQPPSELPPVFVAVTQGCSKHQYVGGNPEGLRRCDKKIRRALRAGGDINAQGSSGQTPLMAAVLQGKPLAVQALLNHGADTTIRETAHCPGCAPLDGAANMGDLEMVEILLAAGANATALGDDGYAPIHRACWGEDRGHMEVVERLLLHGVDPALPTASGRTPFELVQYNQATRELLTMALREAREKEL